MKTNSYKSDGTYETRYDNGQLETRCTYKDGRENGMEIKRYKPHESVVVREMFSRLMPDLSPSDLHDGMMTALNGYLTIDLCRLDTALERLWPEDAESLSMEETVRKHYGDKAVEVIMGMI